MEEAAGYVRLSEEFGLSQEDIANRVGKSRSAVANSMRLVNLDKRVQEFVKKGVLSSGHARTILAVEDGDIQLSIAEKIINEDLSVRETENLIKKTCGDKKTKKDIVSKFNTQGYKNIEENIQNILGTKVKIKAGKNKGAIEIEYYSDDDLDRLLSLIGKITV